MEPWPIHFLGVWRPHSVTRFSDFHITPLPQNHDPQSPLELSPTQTITQESFQAMWESWGDGEKRTCGVPAVPAAEALDAHLSSASIFTIASGDLPDMTKLFIFAQVSRN